MEAVLIVVSAIVIGLSLAWATLSLPRIVAIWRRLRNAGQTAPSFARLVRLGLAWTPGGKTFEAAVAAEAADLDVDMATLDAHRLAGGDPLRVVAALVEARRRDDTVRIERLMAMDLLGYDPLAAARDGEYHPEAHPDVQEVLKRGER